MPGNSWALPTPASRAPLAMALQSAASAPLPEGRSAGAATTTRAAAQAALRQQRPVSTQGCALGRGLSTDFRQRGGATKAKLAGRAPAARARAHRARAAAAAGRLAAGRSAG